MPGLPAQLRTRFWIVALLVALAAVAWDTRARLEHAVLAHALTDQLLPPPAGRSAG